MININSHAILIGPRWEDYKASTAIYIIMIGRISHDYQDDKYKSKCQQAAIQHTPITLITTQQQQFGKIIYK